MAVDVRWTSSGGPLLVSPATAIGQSGSGSYDVRLLTLPLDITASASIVPQSDLLVTFKCRGRTNGGLGGWVQGKVSLKQGITYSAHRDPSGRFTGLFYGTTIDVNHCIMMSAEGGYSSLGAGGNAGYKSGSKGANYNNSGGGGGGTTVGFRSGSGGYGGGRGGDTELPAYPGTAGGLWSAGTGGTGTDGNGGNGGFGYYGGGGGGGGWDWGNDYGGRFGGGGGGGSCYAEGLPNPSVNSLSPAEVIVTNTSGGAEDGGLLFQIVAIESGTSYDHSFDIDGPLIFYYNQNEGQESYRLEFPSNREISVYCWGQGTSNAIGAYARATVTAANYFPYIAVLGGGRGTVSPATSGSENGGGYTGLFRSSIVRQNTILIAGGAGGSGTNEAGTIKTPGGKGGNLNGSSGESSFTDNNNFYATGGGGATVTQGGGGGITNTNGIDGTAGSELTGGNGGGKNLFSPQANDGTGGGGGGGYYGGGGGASIASANLDATGGGGGGGSSYFTIDQVLVGSVVKPFIQDKYSSNTYSGEYIGNPYYQNNAGKDYNALMVISGEPISKTKIRDANVWKDIRSIHVKTSSVDNGDGTITTYDPPEWKQVVEVYRKSGGVWEKIL